MLTRHFTEGLDGPYSGIKWEHRDISITRPDGSVVFEQKGVHVPSFWSLNASTILAQKYFRGALGTPEREHSLVQVIHRVVQTITARGVVDGYLVDDEQAKYWSSLTRDQVDNQVSPKYQMHKDLEDEILARIARENPTVSVAALRSPVLAETSEEVGFSTPVHKPAPERPTAPSPAKHMFDETGEYDYDDSDFGGWDDDYEFGGDLDA